MLATLRGIVLSLGDDGCVLEVGGVGYELGVSANTLAQLPACGEETFLYVRLRVSEAGVALYGFCTQEERALFDQLTQISGVGPKVALAILSVFTPVALATVALSQDATALTAVSGVGKKTATRLLVELQNIFDNNAMLHALASTSNVVQSGALPAEGAGDAWMADALAALTSMGFSADVAARALEEARGIEGATTLEDALAKSLKYLGKGA